MIIAMVIMITNTVSQVTTQVTTMDEHHAHYRRVCKTITWTSYALFITFVLLACDVDQVATTKKESPSESQQALLTVTDKVVDPKILQQGKTLFLKNCSQCHGDKAQGAAEWRKPGPDGKYLPPPLNGTAHAWHHPTEVLMEIIKEGTLPDGNMPSWEGKLSESEIMAVISWLQSLWPDKIFKTWQSMDLSSREE